VAVLDNEEFLATAADVTNQFALRYTVIANLKQPQILHAAIDLIVGNEHLAK
jgi:hypothetical protein